MKDLHNHTIYSDGINTPEEMVLSAIEKGVDVFGLSDHSYTAFDTEYCMTPDRYDAYIREVQGLKEKYKDQIRILCGIEYDLYSKEVPEGLDYIIGSVHYLKINEEYLPIDLNKETFGNILSKYFNDEPYAMCEAYYESTTRLYENTHCGIIGHFDLITKFNEGNFFFDESHPRYIRAWKDAMAKILKQVKCFECNYGAYNKGLRSVPYLSDPMKAFLQENGGTFINSSDSHKKETIASFG